MDAFSLLITNMYLGILSAWLEVNPTVAGIILSNVVGAEPVILRGDVFTQLLYTRICVCVCV